MDEAPGSATILTLGEHMCKWPIGDPAADGFTYCGRRQDDGPSAGNMLGWRTSRCRKKKRADPSGLMRSVERYL